MTDLSPGDWRLVMLLASSELYTRTGPDQFERTEWGNQAVDLINRLRADLDAANKAKFPRIRVVERQPLIIHDD